jgi:hypothetical protein
MKTPRVGFEATGRGIGFGKARRSRATRYTSKSPSGGPSRCATTPGDTSPRSGMCAGWLIWLPVSPGYRTSGFRSRLRPATVTLSGTMRERGCCDDGRVRFGGLRRRWRRSLASIPKAPCLRSSGKKESPNLGEGAFGPWGHRGGEGDAARGVLANAASPLIFPVSPHRVPAEHAVVFVHFTKPRAPL